MGLIITCGYGMVGVFCPVSEVGLVSWVLLDIRHGTPCQLEANSSLISPLKHVSKGCTLSLSSWYQ